ncbi:MAG: hypothetical protein K9J37_14585 [Saprospiraceae bacterium]|nr:hypothetical protein [Saprospiraceae bacterium]MCF8251134.1 hypothetical protein [Saprospiraceae bacterium]MCF8282954.1 hypothetical protein [Bacteroidales bacterium]MCF8312908.1 hypothetical protein [Saprospiraceae bacterium]MCF8441393.1 hypothetical protein [Saprospiraceae bacterium]
MNANIRPAWLVWGLLLCSTFGVAQQPCFESVEYDLEVISFTSIPDEEEKANLTELEKLQFQLHRSERLVKKCLTVSGEVLMEIQLLNPEEIFPEWVQDKPTTAILSRDSLKWLNANDVVILRTARGLTSKSYYNTFAGFEMQYGLETPSSFNAVSLKEMEKFEDEGFSFSPEATGGFIGTKPNETVTISPTSLSITHLVMEDGAM